MVKSTGSGRQRGFTLLELVVVLALLGALLAIAAPRFVDVLDRGRLRAQEANLTALRQAIDAYHGDLGRYPESLDELVTRRYLRKIPVDPVTELADWLTIAPPSGAAGRVWDVRSAAVRDTAAPPSGSASTMSYTSPVADPNSSQPKR